MWNDMWYCRQSKFFVHNDHNLISPRNGFHYQNFETFERYAYNNKIHIVQKYW